MSLAPQGTGSTTLNDAASVTPKALRGRTLYRVGRATSTYRHEAVPGLFRASRRPQLMVRAARVTVAHALRGAAPDAATGRTFAHRRACRRPRHRHRRWRLRATQRGGVARAAARARSARAAPAAVRRLSTPPRPARSRTARRYRRLSADALRRAAAIR